MSDTVDRPLVQARGCFTPEPWRKYRPGIRSYGMAVLAVALASLIRIGLLPVTGAGAPYVLYFGAVLAVAYTLGAGPGLLAGAVSAIAAPCIITNISTFLYYQVFSQAALFFIEAAMLVAITNAFSHTKYLAEKRTQELVKSEERWELAAKATADTIRDWDMVRQKITWSQAVYAVFGYNTIDAVGFAEPSGWLEAIHSQDRERVRQRLAHCLDNQTQQWQDSYRFRHANGTYLMVSDRCYAVYAGDGSPLRVIGAMRDITRQNEAVVARQTSEARLQRVCDTLPALIALTDRDLRFVFVNATFYQWFGLKPEDMLGKTGAEIFGWPYSQRREQALQEVVRGKTSTFEESITRSGCLIPTAQTLVPHLSDSGQFLGLVLLVRDISEEKEHEQVLRQSEEHYRVLTEVSPQATWEATLLGDITYTNAWWQSYTGLDGPTSLGQGWLKAVPCDQREEVAQWMQHAFAGNQQFEGELGFIRQADGETRIHLVRGQPVMDDNNQPSKWVGVAVDIHEQKSTEAQLAMAVSARDNFLSMASHELKTPLTSMQLVTQMMRRSHERGRKDAFEPSKVKKLIAQTDKSVQRLTRIIDDMLDVSRIARGKMAFRFEPFDLCDLVNDVLERMNDQLQANHVAVTTYYHDKAVGTWDRFRIEQVFTNLLTNAMRYGQGSPIEVRVELKEKGTAELVVRDFGPGIAQEDHTRVFDQFERASTQSALGGLGLGLFICREIVERHSGSIELERKNTPGAKFIVNLPLHSPASSLPENDELALLEASLS